MNSAEMLRENGASREAAPDGWLLREAALVQTRKEGDMPVSRSARQTESGLLGLLVACLALFPGCGDNQHENVGTPDAAPAEMPAADSGIDADAGADPLTDSVAPSALDNTRPPYELGSPQVFYRLTLSRSLAGAVAATEISVATLSQQPMPALSLDYALVAYAQEQIVEAVPLSFPQTAIRSTRDANGGLSHSDIPLATSMTTVFFQANAAIDRVIVLDAAGSTVLEMAGTTLPPLPRTSNGTGDDGTTQAPTIVDLAQQYPQISFLKSGQDSQLPAEFLDGATLVDSTPEMNEAIATGLSWMGPALLSSVHSIGVIRWTSDPEKAAGAVGLAAGSNLFLNADLLWNDDTPYTMAHEAAHVFTRLAMAASSGEDLTTWPAAARTLVQKVIGQYRLARGLVTVWQELHEAGRQAGFCKPYQGETAWEKLTDNDARVACFATPQGSRNATEDIAEYAASVLVRHASFGICPVFAETELLSRELATAYAKLTLLAGINVITDANFNHCVDGSRIKYSSGIHFPSVVDFTTGLKAGAVVTNGQAYFDLLGNGPATYQILIELTLDRQDASPLGLHRLDGIWAANVGVAGLSGVYLANDDWTLARAGEQGLVLVTEASTTRTTGAIFGLVLQNALGQNTDYFPFGTFQIP